MYVGHLVIQYCRSVGLSAQEPMEVYSTLLVDKGSCPDLKENHLLVLKLYKISFIC